ncbi:HpcH/HpaI aldolase family protein [Pimelobacter simplex]|uniref:HpcH/HpaI aldolase family protein n=1 Tax=Nocardioides simplex TaxID=2045 RepID=UPI00193253EF|nr:4-hydroxy-2-oxovalerate aldolase [Pimelobacter simplex]
MSRRRGLWLSFLGPFGLEVVAAASVADRIDWLGVDLQHGDLEPSDVAPLVRASRVPVLVRLSSHDGAHLARMLDTGAAGVVVPGVESADQASQLVAAASLPPRGRRSTGLCRAALVPAGDRPLLLAMVETAAGLAAADEIAAVDGVDGIFIGPYDLSLSLGEPSVTTDRMVAAISRVADAARRHGRTFGVFSGNPRLTALLPEVDLLGVATDAAVLQAGLVALFADEPVAVGAR